MNESAESVTEWIEGMKRGDEDAIRNLWNRYFEKLADVARKRIAPKIRRVKDEEDVVVSVFDSLCNAAASGRLTELTNRNDLWKLLLTITKHKVVDLKRAATSEKRGAGQVRGGSVLDTKPGKSAAVRFEDMLVTEVTPEDEVAMYDQLGFLMRKLPDDSLREVARRRMAGETNEEIAARLGVAVRTVERKLARIRSKWSTELER